MKFKKNVSPKGVQETIWFAMGVLHTLRKTITNQSLVVTSLNDGKHMEGSRHYQGQAFDCRIWDIPAADRELIVKMGRDILEPLGFRIISKDHPNEKVAKQHADHDHIEYNPSEGQVWVSVVG